MRWAGAKGGAGRWLRRCRWAFRSSPRTGPATRCSSMTPRPGLCRWLGWHASTMSTRPGSTPGTAGPSHPSRRCAASCGAMWRAGGCRMRRWRRGRRRRSGWCGGASPRRRWRRRCAACCRSGRPRRSPQRAGRGMTRRKVTRRALRMMRGCCSTCTTPRWVGCPRGMSGAGRRVLGGGSDVSAATIGLGCDWLPTLRAERCRSTVNREGVLLRALP